jgi:Endonuclease/Exonuclease/phosphatase family
MQNPHQQLIAFYNLENLFDTFDDPRKDDDDFLPDSFKNWSEERYLSKLEQISRAIASINPRQLPAIIGVAEIENKTVLKDLLYQPEFKGDYDFVHHESPDHRGIDVGFVYNRNFFKVVAHRSIRVEIEGETQYTTRDILHVNGLFNGDDSVHFFINHWPSRREGTVKSMPRRIAAARCLYREAQAILHGDPNAKIVLMGDFNDLPVSKSIVKYLNSKPHKNISSDQFYNLGFLPYRKKMGSLFAKNRWLMFDQILISKGMIIAKGVKIIASRLSIHMDKKLLFYDKGRSMYRPNRTYSGKKYHGGSSDHLPVYVKIETD